MLRLCVQTLRVFAHSYSPLSAEEMVRTKDPEGLHSAVSSYFNQTTNQTHEGNADMQQ
jgi:hypothetical protein